MAEPNKPTGPTGADAPTAPAGRGEGSDLFGRGMVFVVVWSMQLVVATLVSPVLAHLLPIAEFGALAAAIALFQLLMLVAVLGLDQALEMQRLEDPDAHRARGLIAAGTVVALGVTGLAAATASWWGPVLGFPSGSVLLLITLLWTAPGAVVLLMLSLLQAEDRLRRFAVVSVVSTVGSQVAGIALLLLVDRSAETYAWGGVLGQWTALVLGLIWTRPRWRGIVDRTTLARALRLGGPLVLAGLAQFVINAGDRFVVQRLFGEVEVARYQVAFTVGNVMVLLLAFTNRAWLPRLKAVTDPVRRRRLIGSSRDGIYRLLGWALLGLSLAAAPLLRIVAPPSYEPTPLVLVVFLIALGGIPVAAAGATTRLLVTVRDSAPLAWSSAAAVVTKIGATLLLAVPLGLPGVAIGTLLALWVQAVWLRVAVARRHEAEPSAPSSLVFLGLCVLLSAAVVAFVPQTFAWNVARFAVGLALLVPFFASLRNLRTGGQPVVSTP